MMVKKRKPVKKDEPGIWEISCSSNEMRRKVIILNEWKGRKTVRICDQYKEEDEYGEWKHGKGISLDFDQWKELRKLMGFKEVNAEVDAFLKKE